MILHVERPDAPQSLSVQPSGVQLNFIGDGISVDVNGTFADGSKLLMTGSSLLQISTTDPNVAVFQNGNIVAADAGSTTVTFSIGTARQSAHVTVASSARGDLNADDRIDQSDVDILNSALNTPASIVNDARDLNRDGQITSTDQTILQSLCTVRTPLCATH